MRYGQVTSYTETFGPVGGQDLCVCAADRMFAAIVQEVSDHDGTLLVRFAEKFMQGAGREAEIVTCASCGKSRVQDAKDADGDKITV